MIETHATHIHSSGQCTRMGQDECRHIHLASLEILERVGIQVHDPQARQVLLDGGARQEEARLQIPEPMVTHALGAAPSNITLFDRQGNPAMRAGGFRSYFGGGSDCLNILDHRTGRRRKPVLKDVIEAATLMDALPEIDFVMSAFLPQDVDQSIYDRYQMQAMLNHTTKPIVYVAPDFEGCAAAVEMCEAIAGGEEAFRERPFAACYINVTSGMEANAEALQKCLYLAEKGLPQLYIPLNAGGVNSPATTAGCMASMNAGALLGVVLSQLVREGAPIAVPGWNGGPYNLQTMVGNYVLADEQGVAASMGKYYDLPVFGLGGCTDAKLLDQQCGFEATLSLVTALMNGANLVHDLGFMESGLQGSLQLITLADDYLGFLRAATARVLVNDETLALDVIRELGPDGDYLSHDHTYRHFRQPYYSDLADKNPYSVWMERGGRSMEARAAKKVDRLLSSHRVEPLPGDVQKEIKRIVAREQVWIDSQR